MTDRSWEDSLVAIAIGYYCDAVTLPRGFGAIEYIGVHMSMLTITYAGVGAEELPEKKTAAVGGSGGSEACTLHKQQARR